MRIFVALSIPAETLREISEWLDPQAYRYPSLKWVTTDRMHLTLRFFGDIDQDRILRIRSVMKNWKPGPMRFILRDVGTFGKKGSPAVYWLGGDFPVEIQEVASKLGMIPDDRGRTCRGKFTPHLTVARRRRGSSPALESPKEMRGVLDTAMMIDSRLKPEGPEYTILERYDLSNHER
jgi:RNA 2',3'-cyclic 3'-phosphodiesterase